MNPLEALQLQLRLEGKVILPGNRLRQVEIVPDEEMPLMLLAMLADGRLIAAFDESLQQDLVLRLREQTQHIQFPAIDLLIEILNAQNIPFLAGHYKTSLFPRPFLDHVSGEVERRPKEDPQVQDFGFGDFADHAYLIKRDGRVVSACVCIREDKWCGEAWVCTDPHYRRQGLARQVVSAWARDMLSAGKVPFYSHKIENIASAGLAEHLGLLPAFEEMVISYAGR